MPKAPLAHVHIVAYVCPPLKEPLYCAGYVPHLRLHHDFLYVMSVVGAFPCAVRHVAVPTCMLHGGCTRSFLKCFAKVLLR